MIINEGVTILGINDSQIWLAYLASIFSALGCMVYGLLHWTGKDEEKAVNKNAQKPAQEQQSGHT
jgi:hypothetical protein